MIDWSKEWALTVSWPNIYLIFLKKRTITIYFLRCIGFMLSSCLKVNLFFIFSCLTEPFFHNGFWSYPKFSPSWLQSQFLSRMSYYNLVCTLMQLGYLYVFFSFFPLMFLFVFHFMDHYITTLNVENNLTCDLIKQKTCNSNSANKYFYIHHNNQL